MKNYKVVGEAPLVLDGVSYAPGQKFEAKVDAGQEAFLVQTGGLKVLDTKDKKKS